MSAYKSNEKVEKALTANRRLAKKRVQWLIEALYFEPTSVLADILLLRNRQLILAAKCSNHLKQSTYIKNDFRTGECISKDRN